MKNEERLKKAIEKAVKNGYLYADWDKKGFIEYLKTRDWEYVIKEDGYYKIIFSNNFAKALWGEEMIDTDILEDVWMSDDGEVAEYKKMKAWEYHQHKMLDEIQADRNPLLYLEKFL